MVKIRKDDILLGRGPFCYRNPGNVAFRNLIQKYVEGYERKSPRSVKQKIVEKLILKAQNQGRRFLVRSMNSDTWFEAHSYLVHTKVSHALRDARNLSISAQRSRGTKIQKNKELSSKFCQDLHQEQASIEGEINTSIQNSSKIISLNSQDSSSFPAQPQAHILNFCSFKTAWSNISENPNHQSPSCSNVFNPMSNVHLFSPCHRNVIPYSISALRENVNPMEIQTTAFRESACVTASTNFNYLPCPHVNARDSPSERMKNQLDILISPDTFILNAFDIESCKEYEQVATSIWCQGPTQL